MDLTRLAREHGDKPAVVMAGSGATLSYAELDRQSTASSWRRCSSGC
jgi:long-chain acyl-CoA synthetase